MTNELSVTDGCKIEEGKPIEFSRGLVGFPNHKWFTLTRTETGTTFILRSMYDAETSFVVIDPRLFHPGYEVRSGLIDCKTKLLVTCRISDGWLIGNLLGPLLIDSVNSAGTQLVLIDGKWSSRQRLMQVGRAGVLQ